ncbi:MAG: hypothetical protein ACRCSI_02150 [Eubacterium aggregans]
MRERKIPKKIRWGIIVLIILAVALLASTIMAIKMRGFMVSDTRMKIQTDVRCQGDGSPSKASAHRFIWILPPLTQGENTLAFYVVNQDVTIYEDGVLVYSFGAPEGKSLGRSNGSLWVSLPITEKDVGKTFEVILCPVYPSFAHWEVSFFMGDSLDIYGAALEHALPQMSMGTLAILLGIVFCVIAFYGLATHLFDESLGTLGAFALTLGTWKLCDTRFTPFLFAGTSSRLIYDIMLLSLMLSVATWTFNLCSQFTEQSNSLVNLACRSILTADSVMVVLQLAGVLDLREVLVVIHITIILSLLTTLQVILEDWVQGPHSLQHRIRNGLYLLCLGGVCLDLITFYTTGNSMGGHLYPHRLFNLYRGEGGPDY